MPQTITLIESFSNDPRERDLATQALQVLGDKRLSLAAQRARITQLQDELLAHRQRLACQQQAPLQHLQPARRHGVDPLALQARQRELGRTGPAQAPDNVPPAVLAAPLSRGPRTLSLGRARQQDSRSGIAATQEMDKHE